MNKSAAMTALCAAACIPCLAQQATVVVSHNDPDGIVAPGETVQISATLSWTGAWQLEEIMGDVRSSLDAGIASNNIFPHMGYSSNQNTIVNPGVPGGGSVLGMHLRVFGNHWILIGHFAMPWSQASGFEVLRFDWTAPNTPGVVEFNFIPDSSLPVPTLLGPPISAFPFPRPSSAPR